MRTYISVAVLLMLALSVAGCENERDISNRAEQARDSIGSDLKTEWEAKTGEAVSSIPNVIERDSLSESHQIMASMILLGQGMDPDLSTYGEVYLVEFKDADGVQRAAVYTNGKIVLPAGAGQ
ncbi:MAG: hypothetical protein Q8M79_04330 [Dehalococcoidia bacterium]|nr:hypothetical protein [Dehalococcoidia bacterium]